MSSAANIKDDGEQKLQHAKSKKISSSRKECTSREQNSVDDITEGITSIAVLDDVTTCASCGKEGKDSDMNTCNKCNMVKYCNAACKKKHRKKHKKACERRVAELHDEALFKQPPPNQDCPICFLRLPNLASGTVYMACCGKSICRGCIFAVQEKDTDSGLCPFCRTPPPPSEAEMIKRYKKRMEIDNDAKAMQNLGCMCSHGELRLLPQNYAKALELWHQAAELGNSAAYYSIGMAYVNGRGVAVDKKKAIYYMELSAMGGNAISRYNLGAIEEWDGNHYRAIKHYMIAVEGGDHDSLKAMQGMYTDGHATKEDYAKALRSYQAYLDEIRSDQRDEAAAAKDKYKYYESTF